MLSLGKRVWGILAFCQRAIGSAPRWGAHAWAISTLRCCGFSRAARLSWSGAQAFSDAWGEGWRGRWRTGAAIATRWLGWGSLYTRSSMVAGAVGCLGAQQARYLQAFGPLGVCLLRLVCQAWCLACLALCLGFVVAGLVLWGQGGYCLARCLGFLRLGLALGVALALFGQRWALVWALWVAQAWVLGEVGTCFGCTSWGKRKGSRQGRSRNFRPLLVRTRSVFHRSGWSCRHRGGSAPL